MCISLRLQYYIIQKNARKCCNFVIKFYLSGTKLTYNIYSCGWKMGAGSVFPLARKIIFFIESLSSGGLAGKQTSRSTPGNALHSAFLNLKIC